jgi:hypothetical protein
MIQKLTSMLIHDGFTYTCIENVNCKDNIVLYSIVDKHNTIKWIKSLFNFFRSYPNGNIPDGNMLHINISIKSNILIYAKYKWTMILTHSVIPNNYLYSKNLDDLSEIITNDDPTEIIQRIHLKSQIENMM